MLAEPRRARINSRRRAGQFDRTSRDRNGRIVPGLFNLDQHLARPRMRVIENILRAVDGADRHLAADSLDDFTRAVRPGPFDQNAAHKISVGDPSIDAARAIVSRQLGPPDRIAEYLPMILAGRRDRDGAVARRKYVEWAQHRRPVPTRLPDEPRARVGVDDHL